MNITQAFSVYLKSNKMNNLKSSTRSTYVARFQSYMKPLLGELELTQQSIDNFTFELSKKVGNKTANDILGLLKAIVAHSNINIEIIKPKAYRKNVEIFNDTDFIKLTKYCVKHPNYITYSLLLTLFSGIRIGELCACQIQDLDFKNGYLSINKTMQRIKDLESHESKTKVIVDCPKSPNAVRQIPLIQPLVKLGIKLYCNVPTSAYLTTGGLKYYEPRMMEYHYKKMIEKAGVEHKNFHAMRHKFASNFYKNTHDIKALVELLGHADAGTALNTYVHSDIDETRKAITSFSKFAF